MTSLSPLPLTISSPAVLAWGIVMQTLRETALNTRESRETRQSLRAADRYGARTPLTLMALSGHLEQA